MPELTTFGEKDVCIPITEFKFDSINPEVEYWSFYILQLDKGQQLFMSHVIQTITNCEYGDLPDEHIRDQFILGLNIQYIQKKIIRNHSLKSVSSDTQKSILMLYVGKTASNTTNNIDSISTIKKPKSKMQCETAEVTVLDKNKKCIRSWKDRHQNPTECRAKFAKCHHSS
ncbi:hypothetical protein RF11_15333 [Thelohanellus kitauei]|uniref:Uncharacterized protein n=1 Tax=Thelohanellus kitauei TaxID=669202 RepID=A0A0C2MEW2_THEKT|nr:hypothetical protein RF11_15333 [Thelohanellus kitauei]